MTDTVPFDPPLAIASLSGESDADWARAASEIVGAAFLGGIALDSASRAAARSMVDRDREEFLPPDPFDFIDEQLETLESVPVQTGFNLRSTTLDAIETAAGICADHGAIAEINAHCRQEEMCAIGCGESLLGNPDRLSGYVSRAAETGAEVSVKVRAEVPGVDLGETTRVVAEAGAEYVHVDAMDSESVIADVVETAAGTDLAVIANNGVRDRKTTHEYLRYGADAVSVGRPSDNQTVLRRVRRAIETFPRATV